MMDGNQLFWNLIRYSNDRLIYRYFVENAHNISSAANSRFQIFVLSEFHWMCIIKIHSTQDLQAVSIM